MPPVFECHHALHDIQHFLLLSGHFLNILLESGMAVQCGVMCLLFLQILDSVTIREWMHPAYIYHDGFGFGLPWEMLPTGNYTLVTKDGAINGYLAEFRMAVSLWTIIR